MTVQSVASGYAANGFHIESDPIIADERIASARTGMDLVRAGGYDTGKPPYPSPWNPGDDPGALCKIELPQLANRAIAELIASPELGRVAAKITGARMIQVWWVQLLYKPPARSNIQSATKVGWHRDWTYWKDAWEDKSELFTGWFALSDVSEESGPMHFVPGSHQWRNVEGGDFFSQENDQQAFSVPEGGTWTETPATMKAGGVSFHHSLTLHGSGTNKSRKPRCSFAIHLRTEHSKPRNGKRALLTEFIDDQSVCPIIFGDKIGSAF